MDGTGQAGHVSPQHMWITLSSGRYPDVLSEWRKDGTAWKGWCVWAGVGPIVQQAWIDAKQISKVC